MYFRIGAIALAILSLTALSANGGAEHRKQEKQPKPEVQVRGPIVGAVPMVDFEEQAAIELENFYRDVQRQIDEYLAWQHQQDVAAWVAAHTPPPPPRQVVRPALVVEAPDYSGGSCDTVPYAARQIYMRESGCNPASVNGSGCRGIGQACPGSKLPCGADFACQHAWFTGYAMSRYGSWEAAWAAWQQKGWW